MTTAFLLKPMSSFSPSILPPKGCLSADWPMRRNLWTKPWLRGWERHRGRQRFCRKRKCSAMPLFQVSRTGYAGAAENARRSVRIRPSIFSKIVSFARSILRFALAAVPVRWPVPRVRRRFFILMMKKC